MSERDDNAGPDTPPVKAVGRCPICGRSPDEAYRPFCSKRCADVDLSRWLSGAYVIRRAEDEEDDDGMTLPTPANDDEA